MPKTISKTKPTTSTDLDRALEELERLARALNLPELGLAVSEGEVDGTIDYCITLPATSRLPTTTLDIGGRSR